MKRHDGCANGYVADQTIVSGFCLIVSSRLDWIRWFYISSFFRPFVLLKSSLPPTIQFDIIGAASTATSMAVGLAAGSTVLLAVFREIVEPEARSLLFIVCPYQPVSITMLAANTVAAVTTSPRLHTQSRDHIRACGIFSTPRKPLAIGIAS
jgi:hypothetical protein